MALKLFRKDVMQVFYKKALPYAGSLGVISDIATPVASFADYFTILAALSCFALSIYWFFFANRELSWSMDFGFMPRALVYAGMCFAVFGFFSVTQAMTETKKKGVLAAIVPGISEIQQSIFRLEKTTQEISQKLDRIEENLGKKYGVEELQVLVDQEMWEEVLVHLEDIEPTQRKGEWKALLFEAANGYLYDMDLYEDVAKAHHNVTELFKRYKFLKKNEEAMQYRQKIGLRFIKHCLSQEPPVDCEPASMAFIKYDSKSLEDLAMKVGNVTTYLRFPRAAVPFFHLAINSENKETHCKHERVKIAIDNGVMGASNSINMKLTKELAKLCAQEMYAHWTTRLKDKLSQKRKPTAMQTKEFCEQMDFISRKHKHCKTR